MERSISCVFASCGTGEAAALRETVKAQSRASVVDRKMDIEVISTESSRRERAGDFEISEIESEMTTPRGFRVAG
jgi:hypothetical protein